MYGVGPQQDVAYITPNPGVNERNAPIWRRCAQNLTFLPKLEMMQSLFVVCL
jgi:hypothetical protein